MVKGRATGGEHEATQRDATGVFMVIEVEGGASAVAAAASGRGEPSVVQRVGATVLRALKALHVPAHAAPARPNRQEDPMSLRIAALQHEVETGLGAFASALTDAASGTRFWSVQLHILKLPSGQSLGVLR
jgi:hypothetical protein